MHVRWTGALAVTLVVSVWGWACDDGAAGEACGVDRDCPSGLSCRDGQCVVPRDGGGGVPGPSGAGGNRTGMDDAGREDVSRFDAAQQDAAVRTDDGGSGRRDGALGDGLDAAVSADAAAAADGAAIDGAGSSDGAAGHEDDAAVADAVVADAVPADAERADAAVADAAATLDAAPGPDVAAAPDLGARVDVAPPADAAMPPDPDAAVLVDAAVPDADILDAQPSDAHTPDVSPPDAACPPAAELCNALDDDCDGLIDEDFAVGTSCCADEVAPADPAACVTPGSWICADDGSAMCAACVPPTATLACNGVDDDCDGVVDEATWMMADAFLGATRFQYLLVPSVDAISFLWTGFELADGGRQIGLTRTPIPAEGWAGFDRDAYWDLGISSVEMVDAAGHDDGVDLLYRSPEGAHRLARWSALERRLAFDVAVDGVAEADYLALASSRAGAALVLSTMREDGTWSITLRWFGGDGTTAVLAVGEAPPSGFLAVPVGVSVEGAVAQVFWRSSVGPDGGIVTRAVDVAGGVLGDVETLVVPDERSAVIDLEVLRDGPRHLLVWSTREQVELAWYAGSWDAARPAAPVDPVPLPVEGGVQHGPLLLAGGPPRILWREDSADCPLVWVDAPRGGPLGARTAVQTRACALDSAAAHDAGFYVEDGSHELHHVVLDDPPRVEVLVRSRDVRPQRVDRIGRDHLHTTAFGDLVGAWGATEGAKAWLRVGRVSPAAVVAVHTVDVQAVFGDCEVTWSAGGPGSLYFGCALPPADEADGWRLSIQRFDEALRPVGTPRVSPSLGSDRPSVVHRAVSRGRVDLIIQSGGAERLVQYADDRWWVGGPFFDLGASASRAWYVSPDGGTVRVLYRSPLAAVCEYEADGLPVGCATLEVPEDFAVTHGAFSDDQVFAVAGRDPAIGRIEGPVVAGRLPTVVTPEGHAMGVGGVAVGAVRGGFVASNHRDFSVFDPAGERILVHVGPGMRYVPVRAHLVADLGAFAGALTRTGPDIATFFRCD